MPICEPFDFKNVYPFFLDPAAFLVKKGEDDQLLTGTLSEWEQFFPTEEDEVISIFEVT